MWNILNLNASSLFVAPPPTHTKKSTEKPNMVQLYHSWTYDPNFLQWSTLWRIGECSNNCLDRNQTNGSGWNGLRHFQLRFISFVSFLICEVINLRYNLSLFFLFSFVCFFIALILHGSCLLRSLERMQRRTERKEKPRNESLFWSSSEQKKYEDGLIILYNNQSAEMKGPNVGRL